VLVVFERGPAGVAAVEFARLLAEHEHAALTVVSVVPASAGYPRCGCSPTALNATITEAVERELEEARTLLSDMRERARFSLLTEGSEPTLSQFAASGRFDLVLLPARRRPLRREKHPAAAALRREGAEVWVVDPRSAGPR
jgi:hypothetical protein